ncbi:unnamed protein product [Caenorhabditis brenneri]
MVSHTDYPFHGEYQLANPHQLDDHGLVTRLGRVGNFDEWFLQLGTFNFEMKNHIFATLSFRQRGNAPVLRANCYLSFLNNKDTSKSEIHIEKLDSNTDFECFGPLILESDMLDENSGWLKDGELTVEYGVHVEAFKKTTWIFNFHEPTFQYDKAKNSVCFEMRNYKSDCRYCHKQLLIHHSSSIAKTPSKNNWSVELEDRFEFDSLEKCLQIVHGVHIKTEYIDYLRVLRIADYFDLYNVMRYCEMELIQRKDNFKFISNHIQYANYHKLTRYLACALREKESPEAIKESFCTVDIDNPFHDEYQLADPSRLHRRRVVIHFGNVGNSNYWSLHVSSFGIDMQNYIVATFSLRGRKNVPIIRSNCFLSFLNHKDKSKSKVNMEKFESKKKIAFCGVILKESELLEEDSGWLKNGELTVQYGIHVEAFKETIWIFNFHQPTFRFGKTEHTICFKKKKKESDWRYCHKQLLIHHSPRIAKGLIEDEWFVKFEDCFKYDSLDKCLQIINGARITIGFNDLFNVFKVAHYYKLYNVIRYCEMELIQRKVEIKFIRNHISFATQHKLSRYLANVLRNMESPEAIKKDFRTVDIDNPFHGEYQLADPHQLHGRGDLTHVGSIRNSNDWFLQIGTINFDMKSHIIAALCFLERDNGPAFRANYYLSFLNHKDESKSKVSFKKFDSSQEFPVFGITIPKSDVLDENSGWLKDGKLTVEYGIYVEAFKETIWKFNCYQPNFRFMIAKNTIAFVQDKDLDTMLFSHSQLLMHHFPFVSTMDKEYECVTVQDSFEFDSLEKCLQIINGARITIGLNDLFKVLIIADYYDLYNVMRYCEMELIQRKYEIKFKRNHIRFATHYKLSRYLACALRDVESPKAIKKDFRHVDIDGMTGEMMKQCVMYLLKI